MLLSNSAKLINVNIIKIVLFKKQTNIWIKTSDICMNVIKLSFYSFTHNIFPVHSFMSIIIDLFSKKEFLTLFRNKVDTV